MYIAERGTKGMSDSTQRRGVPTAPRRGPLSLVLVFAFAAAAWPQGNAPSGVLQPIDELASRSLQLVQAGDASGAAKALDGFEGLWKPVEDGIRARNLDVYARIEVESSRASAALQAVPPDLRTAAQAIQGLRAAAEDYAAGRVSAAAATGQQGISSLLTMIRQVKAAITAGNIDQASDLMGSFQEMWPLAEGDVQTRSQAAYQTIEKEITQASAYLLSGAGARDKAADVVGSMVAQLEGLAGRGGYSVWDAGLILLREGLEALLVLAALLAALRKSGSSSGSGWIWAGAGTGIAASAVVAVVLVSVISAATAGTARESMEGFVGLASVLVMITVGVWLHGRSNLQAWQGYIKGRVGNALAGGRMWSLYALALFAVLREGAEATVFYIGIAQGIGLAQLVIGIAGAIVLLAVVGFLIIRFSVRLPLHWVFLGATILIYYLAVKITGESIRALQAAAILPSHFVDWLPSVAFLGASPTWETFLPQLLVLAFVLAEIVVTESRRAGARAKAA